MTHDDDKLDRQPEEPHNDEAALPTDKGINRRGLLLGLAAGVGATALGVAGSPKNGEFKSRILARLQQEIQGQQVGRAMLYSKGDSYAKINEYSKGSPLPPNELA